MLHTTEERIIAGGGGPANYLEVIVHGDTMRLGLSGDDIEDVIYTSYLKISDLLAGKCDTDGFLESITEDTSDFQGVDFHFSNEEVSGFYVYPTIYEDAEDYLVRVRINRLLLEQCA